MGDYSSLYKYEKFEIIGDELVPLGIFSVDGDGTMPLVIKEECDPQCGCPEPIYRWIQTEDTVCIEVITYKLQATYSDSSTLNVECDSSTSLLKAESQPTGYAASAMTDAIIGDCVTTIGATGNRGYYYSPFINCYSLTSVTIPNSVTIIGNGAFWRCSGLTNVTIPNSVTLIDVNAFTQCSGLTSIDIPDSVTSIGASAFWSCVSLTSIHIPSGLTRISDNMCSSCPSITSLTIPNAVTYIDNAAFNSCSSIPSVTIPSGVTYIGDGAFGDCSGLTSITCLATTPPTLGSSNAFANTNDCPIYVPCSSVSAYQAATNWSDLASRIEGIPPCSQPTPSSPKFTLTLSDSSVVSAECDSTSAVTNGEVSSQYSSSVVSAVINDCVAEIGAAAFYRCTKLTSCTIPNSVTTIAYNAFNSCSGLTSIDIPNSVTTISGKSFNQCSGLTSVTIGSGIETIGNSAFYKCGNLQSITINATTPPMLVPYYQTYENFSYTNDCPIYVPCASVDTYKAATGWSTYASRIQGIPPCGQPTPTIDGKFKLTLNDSSTVSAECDSTSALTRNEISAYSASVTSVVIGNCVTELQGGYGYGVFEECYNLKSVTIPSSVTTIGGYVFNHCHGLTSVTIPDSVTSIGTQAFSFCYNLTSATIGSGATSIISDVFLRCTNLTTITIDSNNSTYDSRDNCNAIIETNSNKLIEGCKGTHIPAGILSIGFGAFMSCTGLTSIDIPNSVTSIDQSAFDYCTSLTSVTIGNGLTSIGAGAFQDCSSLTSIDIPNSVTSIDQNAFQDCNALTGITIPSGVTSIGLYAFKNCSGLTRITCEATTPPTLGSRDPFYNTNNCPIYVPSASVSAYQSAWSAYASRIQAIP